MVTASGMRGRNKMQPGRLLKRAWRQVLGCGVCRGRGGGGGDTQAVVSMEQALPLRANWLNFNRFRARAEHTLPLGPYRLLLCGKGERAADPRASVGRLTC